MRRPGTLRWDTATQTADPLSFVLFFSPPTSQSFTGKESLGGDDSDMDTVHFSFFFPFALPNLNYVNRENVSPH